MTRKILLPFCLLFSLLMVACVKKAQVGETHVARGEMYRTGQVAFDEFFEDVNVLQKETKTIKEEETKALGNVAKVLGLNEPSAQTVFVAVKERARKLAESKKGKAFMALEGIDDHGRPQPGKQVTVTATGPYGQTAPKEVKELAAALDQAAKAEGQLAERTFPMADKAKRRSTEAARLRAQVDAEFTSKAKREEVEREIDAAAKVLVDVAQKCEAASASASGFLRDTQQAFASAAETKGKGKGKGGAKAGVPAKKPAAETKAPGGPGADFNP
jgi:hypothetical protein